MNALRGFNAFLPWLVIYESMMLKRFLASCLLFKISLDLPLMMADIQNASAYDPKRFAFTECKEKLIHRKQLACRGIKPRDVGVLESGE